mgnify:CR=1 FL=1|jgi:hypothetical protein
MVENSGKQKEKFDPDDPETLKLSEELGEILKPYVPQDINVA